MPLGKLVKWGASSFRIAAAKLRLGSRLRLQRGGKPVYLGRGVRLMVEPGGRMELGAGAYIDDRSRLQVGPGATMRVGEHTYMNTNVRVVAAERIEIGAHTMVGPNVCIYDHDHVFDSDGVHGELKTAPVQIGERCWLGANALVTRGVTVADRILAGGVRRHALSLGARVICRQPGEAHTRYVRDGRWRRCGSRRSRARPCASGCATGCTCRRPGAFG